jgi:hypothetical protein
MPTISLYTFVYYGSYDPRVVTVYRGPFDDDPWLPLTIETEVNDMLKEIDGLELANDTYVEREVLYKKIARFRIVLFPM